MKEEKIVLVGIGLEDLDRCLEEYASGADCRCIHYQVNGKNFCLICNSEMTRLILYVRRDYVERNGKLFYVDMHAIKSYKSYNDCLDNLNGDLDYWAMSEVEEEIL